MQFTKLRLSGFKSFVEPSEFVIAPGLTGVVGPNGCGKSNLVEALRWVMGENRVKQMRGGEMDDVIFAGTTGRPSRNVAEVSLVIDNATRKAPAAFNDAAELEVSRRIERGEGSVYRISGREVRARDVQTFFADAATGSHSPALVSQGRIEAIINAKPAERRALLEEAAGISGLHARRHEAELKLRAAEQNLARLDDVINTLDGQLQGLKKQARQAARYRNLSDLIRRAEAAVLARRWHESERQLGEARARLAGAEERVAALTGEAANAASRAAESESAIEPLRKDEAVAAAEVARLVAAREQIEQDDARLRHAMAEVESRTALIARDQERERQQTSDAEAALAALANERQQLLAAREAAAAERAGLADTLERIRARLGELEHEVDRAAAELARLEALRATLTRDRAQALSAIERLGQRIAAIDGDLLAQQGEDDGDRRLEAANLELRAAEGAMTAREAAAEASSAARLEAQNAARLAREEFAARESELRRLDAEAAALAAVLQQSLSAFKPVLDELSVEPGYEAAVSAALGDDLLAALDAAAPTSWHEPAAGEVADLPPGAEPLSRFVQAPAALARRLSQIGVAETFAATEAMAAALRQGQRLVSREGGLRRWDGFVAQPGADTVAAARLIQRNRLAEIEAARLQVAQAAAVARESADSAVAASRAADQDDEGQRQALRAAFTALGAARDRRAALAHRIAEHRARLNALAREHERLTTERDGALARAEAIDAELASQPDIELARADVTARRGELQRQRDDVAGHDSRLRQIDHEASLRARRIEAIAAEEIAWCNRLAGGRAQLDDLALRATRANEERDHLAGEPARIAARRASLFEASAAAEAARDRAADHLAVASEAAREAMRALRAAEAELAGSREDRVRAEAIAEQADAAAQADQRQIHERFECAPGELLAAAGIDPNEELPPLPQAEARLDRLTRERETMGPVNLRAEEESAEIERQMTSLASEKDDLVRAIQRLRHGITSLNREGRERLLAAFGAVDKHFQAMFQRLFGGGRAHLALTNESGESEEAGAEPSPAADSDDPLDAGLEIMASPEGKNLKRMSLLSGGEKAKTALALLFAVFLTNPAPICVLDEVDAPLDDANVDRFCSLVDEIARETGTRFIIVTHHRMTMARMDRLYGVTMGEQGVSQLVSVDLARAEALRATA